MPLEASRAVDERYLQQDIECDRVEQSHLLKEQLKLNRSKVCKCCVVDCRLSGLGGDFDLICVATFPKQSQKMMRSKHYPLRGLCPLAQALPGPAYLSLQGQGRCVERWEKITGYTEIHALIIGAASFG